MTSPALPRQRSRWSAVPGVIYHALLAVLVLALGVMLVWRPVLGRYDFWAHAAVGRWVCENGRAPDRSLFLWTADEPWVYHSWLTQVTFYGLTRLCDFDSLPLVLMGFTAVVALAPFALAWGVWAKRTRPTCGMALPFAVALEGVAPRLETRPELFTTAFLSVLLVWLALRTAPDTDRPVRFKTATIVGAFCAFVVWANLHGAVVIGIQVLVVTAVCDFLQNRRDGLWKVPALLAVLAPVAACVNPYGPAYWTALVPVNSTRFSEILEWYPVWRGPALPGPMVVSSCVVGVLALAAWTLNTRRRWAQVGWVLMFAVMFVLARRNVWPFTVTCLIVLAVNARSLDPEALWAWVSRRKTPPPLPPVLRWAARVFVLAWLILYMSPVYIHMRPWRNQVPHRLRDGLVAFVNAERPEGRVFNDYENSSFLQYSFSGRPALFIDLLNAYPDEVMQDYRDVVTQTDRGRVLIDERAIDVVILTTNRGGGVSLAKVAGSLDGRPDWVRVYANTDGAVWLRRTAANARIWRRLEGTVNPVAFATLERWGDEGLTFAPATIPEKWR